MSLRRSWRIALTVGVAVVVITSGTLLAAGKSAAGKRAGAIQQEYEAGCCGFAVEVDGRVITPPDRSAKSAFFTDRIGSGEEIRHRWNEGVEIERWIRLYCDRYAILIGAQIRNKTSKNVTLGTVKMLSAPKKGVLSLGDLTHVPAAVSYPGPAPLIRPAPQKEMPKGSVQRYSSNGVLALRDAGSGRAMIVGLLSAAVGNPSIHTAFQVDKGVTELTIASNLGGRILRPGQTIVLDPAWISCEDNAFQALEHYGDAVAAIAPKPVRTGANALWCSWYPLRMTISESNVLEHAEIVAKYFKPLGLDLLQLDHGWQRGDICGDWFPNERFPHGLKWLAKQLRSRYGLKLGLWIAPSQVAHTSQLFRQHPDWMRCDAQGKPIAEGRWYWKPNPEMSQLDASKPAAEKWIADTFVRLTAEGACYYKIDFIAGAPSLRKAMAAIRRGAGPNAWIRYCQTPPLLSVHLANSSYIGADTGDAGLSNWIDLIRENVPGLAASYWINDRLYHREVCDMGVGPKASVEEARLRLSLMTLSGCSISFSDDFRTLDLPRIRMMQQCLPAGNPMARPLDLFARQLPSLWHMHCQNAAGQWDVVGLFNFENQPKERTVQLASVGIAVNEPVVAFEFWEERMLGAHRGQITLKLAPHTARVLIIHRLPTHPEVVATNMHLLGGYHEIRREVWDEVQMRLSGQYCRAAGMEGKAFLYVPDGYRLLPGSALTKGSVRLAEADKNLWVQDIRFDKPHVDWRVGFIHTTAAQSKQ